MSGLQESELLQANPHAVSDVLHSRPSAKRPSADHRPSEITFRLVLCIIAATFGSVHFGWNTGVINNPKPSIVSFLNESMLLRFDAQLSDYSLDLLWSACVSIFAIGGMAGALAGGHFAERVGRQRALICNCVLGLVAALVSGLSAVCVSPEMLIIGRLLTGVCSAAYTCIVPVYFSEIAPVAIRGAIGVMNQLGVVTGLLLSQILSMSSLLGNDKLWPLTVAGGGACCLLQLLLLPLCPESPRYILLTRNSLAEARASLGILRGVAPDNDDGDDGSKPLAAKASLDTEIAAMFSEQQQQQHSNSSNSGLAEFCTERKLLIPLLIGIGLHLSQQLSGINVIFYYSSDLFRQAGASDAAAAYGTVAVGGIMVALTVVSVPLMEAAGRRTLHLVGLLFIVISSAAFSAVFFIQSKVDNDLPGLTYASIAFALLIVVAVAIGPGSIPWLIVSEMFGQRHRSTANSVCVLVNWLANFSVGLLFPILVSGLGPLLFIPFTIATAVLLLLLFKFMPETKGRTADDVAASFASDC